MTSPAASLSIKSFVTLHNGVHMPLLGLGTYKSIDTIQQAIQTAYFQCGIPHFDTAAFYQNEREIGNALKQLNIARQDVFLTSKLWYTEHGYDKATRAFNESIQKLGTEYLDLYLVHWPGTTGSDDGGVSANARLRRETWRALEDLYRAGKVKAIGVSNYTEKHLREMLDDGSEFKVDIAPMVNQFELHPLLTQKSLIRYCEQHRIVVESYSPFAKGKLLSGNTSENGVLHQLATKYGVSVAQLIVRWTLQQGIVCIPKSDRPQRIASNANVFHFEISDEDMKKIDDMNQDYHCTWNPYEVE